MKSKYIREQKRYTKNELMKLLELEQDDFTAFTSRLKSYGVLKTVSASKEEKEMSELAAEEIQMVDDSDNTDNHYYVFPYVGLLTAGGRVLKCYPKYITDKDPLKELKQILQVLKKYNAKEQSIHIYSGEDENESFNKLAVMLYLMEDYQENGAYTNHQENIVINGSGEILWDETVNESFALIKNNRPYYMELRTMNEDEDEGDYFRRLHKSIVTDCSNVLGETGIRELFGLERTEPTDETLEELGEDDYILYRLQKELDIQFNDRKKMLLKTMYTYIAHRKSDLSGPKISMFGTASFHLVWEDVCKQVFRNCLNKAVKDLPLADQTRDFGRDNRKLIDIIEKPKWRYKDTGYATEAKKTLIPDLVSIYKAEDKYCFSILDAKYYLIQIKENSVKGQPGVEDVTKQYLYHLAYRDFIRQAGYSYVQNAFLVPGEAKEGEYLGRAEFHMMSNMAGEKLKHISIIKLPAAIMYDAYMKEKENPDLFEILRENIEK